MKAVKKKAMKDQFSHIVRISFFILLVSTFMVSCNKDKLSITDQNSMDNYSNMKDFFNQNGAKTTQITVDNAAGSTITTAQGTKFVIPPMAFVSTNGNAITSPVTLEIKDIYNNSDMILSGMFSTLLNGVMLKSGGMFYIKATSNNSLLLLKQDSFSHITVKLPFHGQTLDQQMMAFVFKQNNTGTQGHYWNTSGDVGLTNDSMGYLYSLHNLISPLDSGTWGIAGNAYYIQNTQQTTLTARLTDNPVTYDTKVFLIVPGINGMVSVSKDTSDMDFTYHNAQLGTNCTLVAIGVKDHQLFYAMQNITITANMVWDFSMTQISTDILKTKLNQLNN